VPDPIAPGIAAAPPRPPSVGPDAPLPTEAQNQSPPAPEPLAELPPQASPLTGGRPPRTPRPAKPDIRGTAPAAVQTPTEAELFYNARVALERGDLTESKSILETLLARDPSLAGASELYLQVTDQIWEQRLPLVLGARHKHRLGACEGELTLTSLGIRYTSGAHDWAFRIEEIRVVERPDESTLFVETFEKDMLSLGKNKRYKFELDASLEDADWTRYQRVLN
jgi:hypothetical protein